MNDLSGMVGKSVMNNLNIWMMHNQMKVEHFQFWRLHSIEFRINSISKKVSQIEKAVNKHLEKS